VGDVLLNRHRLRTGHISHVVQGTDHGFNRNIIQSENVNRARVGADGVLVRSDLWNAGRKRGVLGGLA
jgi:hypothetical protein